MLFEAIRMTRRTGTSSTGETRGATRITPFERRTARDGRHFVLRPARPTDARALARLFSDVRAEGRYLVARPSAADDSYEAFFIRELIRDGQALVLVAEADGEVIGNVLITREPNNQQDHLGTLSICVAQPWRDVGVGSALVSEAQRWARDRGLSKVALSVFPDNERAIAVYRRAGFVREGVRRQQYRVPEGGFRDELLMAWFPPGGER